MNIENVLIKYGFTKDCPPNLFTKDKLYKAVIWKNNEHVTISRYTPNTGRHLHTAHYNDANLLENDLKNQI